MRFSVDTLAEVVTLEITDSVWYKILIKLFECFAGVMIGREILFKKIAKSGKQIIGITFVQSIGTFLFVSAVFAVYILPRAVGKNRRCVFGRKADQSASRGDQISRIYIAASFGRIVGVYGNCNRRAVRLRFLPCNHRVGTIVAAATINEIIAVIIAKYAFKGAGEIAEQ